MELRVLELNVNKRDKIFDSHESQQLIEKYGQYYQKVGFHPPWVAYLVLSDGLIVGSCGFGGRPKNGKVEIAFWTYKKYQKMGVASFACKELIKISFLHRPKITIIAYTEAEENHAVRILKKNNFNYSETVTTKAGAKKWLWKLKNSEYS